MNNAEKCKLYRKRKKEDPEKYLEWREKENQRYLKKVSLGKYSKVS